MKILLDGGDFPTAFPERDRLLLELMYGAGLRVSEATQIRLDDLRPEQDAILINGKGGPYGKNAKHRLVPLNPKSRSALDAYLVERDKVASTNKTEPRALFSEFAASSPIPNAPAAPSPSVSAVSTAWCCTWQKCGAWRRCIRTCCVMPARRTCSTMAAL